MHTPNYDELEKYISEVTQIGNILSIISWDQATYIPLGSIPSRQEEIVTLSTIKHNMLTCSKLSDLLEKAEEEHNKLDSWQQSNIRRVRHHYLNKTCISSSLQAENVKAAIECEFIWRSARANNDFKSFIPSFKKVLNTVKEIAEIKSQVFKVSKYDSLINNFDQGFKSADIKQVYAELAKELPIILQKVLVKQQKDKILIPQEKIDIAMQKQIAHYIMKIMGFDFSKGRLDESTHPFCGGTSNDTRLTTRYKEDDMISGLMGVIHETGHGLYEQNLPKQYSNQFVGRSMGMAFHESQSLIMEMQIARSYEFTQFLSKLLHDKFGFKGAEYSQDNLYKLINKVSPSFIRVDADEVTYPMHVIIRFEIEEAFIEGNLKIEDLPDLWNTKMQQYLGITPSNYTEGCLQDIHWPYGMFGYFPSYTNGAIIASMVMNKVKNEHNEWNQDIKQGNFKNINHYLNENFRKYGSLYTAEEFLLKATDNNKVNTKIYLEYLSSKYLN